MRILVNLVSGQIFEFALPAAQPADLLKKIKPSLLFKRPLHQYLGKLVTVSINPDSIEWIEVETSDFPEVFSPFRSVSVWQLSEETFRLWLSSHKDGIKAAMANDGSQNVLLAYGQATFRSGRSLYLEVRSSRYHPEERNREAQKIFNMPALFVMGERAGLYIVNPRNISVWEVVPGLKYTGHFSVAGELIGVRTA